MSHPVLLMIGSGLELMRGYMLKAAADRHSLVLIDTAEPTWQRPYVADHHVVSDLHDLAAVTAAADALAERWNVAGVLTHDEFLLLPAARLAEHLGLPGNSPTAVAAARDKATTRQLLAAADVPSAASTWVHSIAAAASAAERLGGFPVVLKPSSSAGGMGVIKVSSYTDLSPAWEVATSGAAHQGPEGQDGGVLLEEFLDGPEISVETVTAHGTTTVAALTHKSVGFAPYFMETGHLVDGHSESLIPAVTPITEAALRAVGITHGVSHVEIKLTPHGPRIVEVNARLAGDRIGQLVRMATGIDLAAAAADLAMGIEPQVTPLRASAAAIGMVYPDQDGEVISYALEDGDDSHVAEWQWLCRVGDKLSLTPSPAVPNSIRAGFGIVTAATPASARTALDALLKRAHVTVAPALTNAA
ncbi:ATP-grasp domain-containing protein [Streptomyces venezuelae]|uniref:ATP-grasp domain-containing protein n=1 Tax=Streptomyces venezuelae TaxID=54571 RepID=UPI003439F6E6